MAISREEATAVFEDLLALGLRPVLTGFRSLNNLSTYWPKGTEGFFIYAHFSSTTKLGALIEQLAVYDNVAKKHGLVAWFSGEETDYNEGRYDGEYHQYRVSFERSQS